MAISFHCKYCGKKIEAADAAGGKWGKCPSCHNKVYIPDMNNAEGEELKLAPIDDDEERRKKQLMAETFRLEQDILLEREDADIPRKKKPASFSISDKELTKNIIYCLRQMANGELEEAHQTAIMIESHGSKALEILDRIALSDIPEPELSDIPQQVLSGLIRNLRNKITNSK